MKRLFGNRIIKILLLFIFMILPHLSRAEAGSTGTAVSTPLSAGVSVVQDPTPTPVPDDGLGSKPPLTDGAPAAPPVLIEQPAANASPSAVQTVPTITVWHENDLKFGQRGNPQQWVNILGNVSGVSKSNLVLSYRLNGSGGFISIADGADVRRLSQAGDFNIEIDYADLQQGSNTVEIKAVDNSNGDQKIKSVTFNYDAGNTWPTSFVTNWSTGDIYDSANVVDGDWAIVGGKLRPQVLDYDRLVAIGDVNWDDYQVTVPFTIHGIDAADGFGFPSYGPGVGLILRWQGHYQKTTEQPRIGWEKLGTLSWYHWSDVNTAGLQMIGYSFGDQYPGGGNILDTNSSIAPLNYSTEYIYKANVATTADGAMYRFKVWRSDLLEPTVWHMTGTLDDVADAGHLTSGSMLLVAHHVDVSFGNVTIEPLSAVRQDLDITTDGNGSVDIDPSGQTDYLFDSDVELTAVPDPGYRFVEWQKDLTGSTNPQTITMDNDKKVTAVFEALPVLTVNTVGSGHVDRSPGGPGYYDVGEPVELTAVADFGYIFTGWSGSIGGITNPQTITMDGDKTVTATFAEITAPLSDNFNRCTPLTVWTTAGVGTIDYNGTQATLTVPDGSSHELTVGNKDAVRLMQPSEDNNFGIEVKFQSVVSADSQMQGIVVQQNTNTFLRFDFNSDGADVYASASRVAGGSETTPLNVVTSPGGAKTWYLRVTRAGNNWTLAYSFNGSNWTTVGDFDYAMTVNSVGVFAGNAGSNPLEHTAVVDYFNHTGAPSSDDPLSDQLTVNKVGDGAVNISPISYSCGDLLTLTAVPDKNWEFVGWDGAVSGTNEEVNITFDVGLAVTANFEQSGSEIYLPFVIKP